MDFHSPATYRLTRQVFLRFFGFIYFVGFLVALNQYLPLLGSHGLYPTPLYLERVREAIPGASRFLAVPTLFWLDCSDRFISGCAWAGILLSVVVMAGFADAPILFVLWALYASFVHAGQLFYGYGWEMMMIEAGFLAIFLAPPLDPRLSAAADATPKTFIWLYRWMTFRLMFGAGMIKMRGDACWRNLSCLDYHFETQPIPNPLSWYFHNLPHALLHGGVLFNHFTELVAPWFLFFPGAVGAAAALVIIAFQSVLILSGNLSWLNWFTICLCVPALDDRFLGRLMPARWRRSDPVPRTPLAWRFIRYGAAALLLILSVAPARNLFSSEQVMNGSFDPVGLVNTYGAFGSVGKARDEVILEGTDDPVPDDAADWKEYEFPCKPGDVDQRPCWLAPYQERITWQLWFAAMSSYPQEPWLVHLAAKLLNNDPLALELVSKNPFPKQPPRYIRARLYRYTFTKPSDHTKAWWTREELGPYLPPLSKDDPGLRDYLEHYGWTD